MDTNTYETFPIKKEVIGDYVNFLKESDKCLVMKHDGKVISIKGNPTVDLVVTEASPAVRGNTANSATKTVTVETGYKVNVPLFIEKGDIIKINTESGEYSGKAN
jgi:elongation factor P